MKIVHTIPRIAPAPGGVVVGGSVNALLTLLRRVRPASDFTLYCQTESECKPRFGSLDLAGITTVAQANPFRPNTWRYGAYYLTRGFLSLRRLSGARGIVHGHSGFAPYALLTWLLGAMGRRRCFHTLYCPVEIRGRVMRWLMRQVFNRHERVFAMSGNVADSLARIGVSSSKIRSLPPYVDVQRFQQPVDVGGMRRRLGVRDGLPLVLFVGNLKRSKGLDVLAKALAQVGREHPMAFVYTLEFLTDEERALHDRIVAPLVAVGDRVQCIRIGFFSEMPALIASADAVAVPFRDTQGPSDYPIVIMEAMASGVPCVGTRVGGIPELITDGVDGLVVEPGDDTALAAAFGRILGDAAFRSRLGRAARARADSDFSPDRVVAMVVQEYANGSI